MSDVLTIGRESAKAKRTNGPGWGHSSVMMPYCYFPESTTMSLSACGEEVRDDGTVIWDEVPRGGEACNECAIAMMDQSKETHS